MKKYLLLLLSIASFAQTNPTSFNKIKVLENVKDNLATRVIVQDSITKELKWVLKSSIVGKTNISIGNKTATTFDINSSSGTGATAPSVTTTEAGLMAATDKVKLNGISNGATANNTDAQLRDRATHTGVQAISTVTGLQAAIDLKANLASPTFTGTPTAPTATAGTNTTQLATTAFVLANGSSGALLTTTSQNFTGVKSATNTGTTQINGFYGINNGTGTSSVFRSDNSSIGNGIFSSNTSTGSGIFSNNSSTGFGMYSANSSTGNGIFSSNSSTGNGMYSANSSTGNGIVSSNTFTGTGFNYVGQNNGANTFTVDKFGAVTGGSFARTGGLVTDAQMANGTVKAIGNVDNTSDLNKPISTATQAALNGKENSFSKNTAFNKNFGTTSGTVVEGGTLGANAYTSTAYLPLSGGNMSGHLASITSDNGYNLELIKTGGFGSNIAVKNTSALSSAYIRFLNASDIVTSQISPTNNGVNFDTGNIGINQPTPTEKLDVVGKGKFSEGIILSGNAPYTFKEGGFGWLGYPFETNGMSIAMSSATRAGGPYVMSLNSTNGFHFQNSDATQNYLTVGSGNSTFNGTVTATNFIGSASLTGTPTAPTATAGTNTTQIATTAFVQGIISQDNNFTGANTFNDITVFNDISILKSYTVATLPTGMIQGAIAYVSDGLTPTYRGIVLGGGAEKCLVFYDGTNWRF